MCRGLDLTQNHLKFEKKTKKGEKKNCARSGNIQITDPALNPLG